MDSTIVTHETLGRVVARYEDAVVRLSTAEAETARAYTILCERIDKCCTDSLSIAKSPNNPLRNLEAICTHAVVAMQTGDQLDADLRQVIGQLFSQLGIQAADVEPAQPLHRLRRLLETVANWPNLADAVDRLRLVEHEIGRIEAKIGIGHGEGADHENLRRILESIDGRAGAGQAPRGLYLAAPWSRRDDMRELAKTSRTFAEGEGAAPCIVSTWHDQPDASRRPDDDDCAQDQREMVRKQIKNASALVVFVDGPESRGIWYEIGLADAYRVPVLIVSHSDPLSIPDTGRQRWTTAYERPDRLYARFAELILGACAGRSQAEAVMAQYPAHSPDSGAGVWV